MLLGEHHHSLDSKNRLSLPAKFRKELGKTVVVTHGLEHCLFMFSAAAWQKVADKLQKLPLGSAHSRGLARFILASAEEVSIDRVGRILLPGPLKEFAHIERDVVVAGLSDRVELWEAKAWSAYRKELDAAVAGMAQALGEAERF